MLKPWPGEVLESLVMDEKIRDSRSTPAVPLKTHWGPLITQRFSNPRPISDTKILYGTSCILHTAFRFVSVQKNALKCLTSLPIPAGFLHLYKIKLQLTTDLRVSSHVSKKNNLQLDSSLHENPHSPTIFSAQQWEPWELWERFCEVFRCFKRKNTKK